MTKHDVMSQDGLLVLNTFGKQIIFSHNQQTKGRSNTRLLQKPCRMCSKAVINGAFMTKAMLDTAVSWIQLYT
jgi:hypothetical protein